MAGALASVLGTLFVQLPLGAALIAGFVLALQRRRHNPRAARLLMIGIVLSFVALVLTSGIRSFGGFLNVFAHGTDFSADTVNLAFAIVNVIVSLLAATAWILAAIAMISRRPPREQQTATAPGAGSA